MQPPKTEQQIENMRAGGRIMAQIFADLRRQVGSGTTEVELDEWVENEIKRHSAIVTYKTPEVNFPGAICISVNDEIVHHPPGDRTLARGDVVKFDLVITYGGMKVDSAFTMVVDETPAGAKKHLLVTTERAMLAGIAAAKPGRVGDISAAVEDVLHRGKLGIVRELAGHGIGETVHMPPDVPNYGRRGGGALIQPGDTICIEPMAMLGSDAVRQTGDGWTFTTRDGSLAAHFEHTVLITDDGAEILTQL
ncbi:MAG: type I methionyl aminopeptidase [Candidatus Nomurabacteria bacterium]|nr:type I methionyl aminopeptidase [Candidatus Nomurabacteria bacterium]